ncbi:efflux RND transporter permease subunit [Puniceicoccales bacterium CK1056]|uniref:Efflux RND transporter permease subunit n=1 Tax=Oceanipulchritudo coccoides TaxID=2706888 RepID=A0A6B2M177_9BACT|nr:efflux RND transporter permease subunit [Oceanipulchritudo coccoides]NDV61525.1 efflux RND transporter permease subunit [Oceanipulchritudo coccoides]
MIRWFARNGVAANLVMLIIVVGGVGALFSIKQELFPEFSLDTVVVRVPYLGAAPEEVEQGVILRVEEAVQGVDGIKEIQSRASEGYGQVSIEISKGADISRVKDDIKARVDAITSFPVETERPIVEELLLQRDVVWVSVYGDTSERNLKEMAEKVRDDITRMQGVSQAFVQGIRSYEISIEVSEFSLRKYGLTFDQVVQAVRRGSLDVPGGSIRSDGGEILLRTKEQAYNRNEFEGLVVKTQLDGTRVLLQDIANVVDGFVDDPVITTFNGKPAALVLVREVGRESPLVISEQVNKYIEEARESWLPESISLDAWGDSSYYLRGRLNMLIENGLIGFVLVLLSLSLFLRPSLAFFVAIGIPVSFLGTFLVAPFVGISVNLISLFAFILVLGIVVDDAIVVGESVFSEFQKVGPGVESAIRGTHLVSTPVTYAVLTTMVAFLPVFMLPGQLGKFFAAIPMVVIPTLFFSLVQSKLVLPYHLSLCKVGDRKHRDQLNVFSRAQRWVADGLESFVHKIYRPTLAWCLEWRYLTIAAFVGFLILMGGLTKAGWVKFSPFPNVPSDFIAINLKLPEGTPIEQTQEALDKIGRSLDEIVAEDMEAGKSDPIKHFAQFIGFGAGQQGTNLGFFFVELTKSELRDSDAEQISKRWREKIGTIPGARELTISAFAGPPTGLPVDIRLTGPDFEQLRIAAKEVREELAEFPGLFDIRDTFSEGKREIKLKLKPSAESLGIRVEDLARQVRAAFYGAEAQRIQRGRDDIRVMVRYPYEDRVSLANFENMRIRLPGGTEIPINEVAELEIGEGFPTITRIDRQRVINIQADADKSVADFAALNKALYDSGGGSKSVLEEIQEKYPGVTLVKGGEAKDWEETKASLLGGVILVIFMIYALLAIPFKSYLQPLIVMSVVPFGIAGAVLGHFLTFQTLSLLSMLGIIALSGVVVNDSLVLVDYINRRREHGMDLMDAVREAGIVRFRPILLTSLTTFMGLVPILLERSLQAQFLIPMATSLGFGVLFATFITLLMVPSIYMVLEDAIHAFKRWLHLVKSI